VNSLFISGTDEYPIIGRVQHYGHYDIKEETTTDFCIGWRNTPCDLIEQTYSFSTNAWMYTSATDIWGIPITGMYTLYGGGGYIAELDVNRDMSQNILAELTKNRWIDRSSRAVFLEFTLYSPNVNMFTHAIFLTELPETGGILTTYSLYPFRVYQHHGRNGVMMIVGEVLFLAATIILSWVVVLGIYKQWKNYFKSVLNCLNFVILLTCLCSIGLYTARLITAMETMNKFTKQPKDFLNFQHIVALDSMFVLVFSILQALVTVRLIGNLKIFKPVEELWYVLLGCFRDLIWFSVIFWYIIVVYAYLGTLLFGRNLVSYMNLISALETLTTSVLGKSNFSQINQMNPILAKIYFVLFITVQVYFLLTIFLVILCENINVARNIRSPQSQRTMITNLQNFFKGLFKQQKFEERGKNSCVFSYP